MDRVDQTGWWFRQIWRVSDVGRRVISRLPFAPRKALALTIYWPLARSARLVAKLGANVRAFPLGDYRSKSFYAMRTDALDRFGTRLEKRFTRKEIEAMMRRCGLGDIVFQEGDPFWCACGRRTA